jgi:translation initiation factor IF-3
MAFTPSRPPSSTFSRSRLLKGKMPQNKDDHRINEMIRVPQVRLIDEKGGQVGVVATREALRMAQDVNLDLMEVAPNAKPPVCKICDYGKFKYEKKKKEHAARKKQTVIKVKEIQLRPNTDTHDLDYKFKNARKFLEDGDKVKVTMMFRGRQMAHQDIGRAVMDDVVKKLEDCATLEARPKLEGRKMIMVLSPSKAKKAK